MSDSTRDNSSFDFDQWMALAQSDPEAFEARRREVLQAEIAKAPEAYRQRLTGLQWRIDIERGRCKNSLVSAQKVFGMMWKQVYGPGGLADALNGLVRGEPAPVEHVDSEPKVLQFRKASSSN